MTARNHRFMGVRRQTCDDLTHACNFSRNDGHDRRRQKWKAATRHIATDALNGNYAVAEVHAGQDFNLQRQDRRQLRLGKAAHIGNGEFRVCAGLRIKGGDCGLALLHRHLETA